MTTCTNPTERLSAFVVVFDLVGPRGSRLVPTVPAILLGVDGEVDLEEVLDTALEGLEEDWEDDEHGPLEDWTLVAKPQIVSVCDEWVVNSPADRVEPHKPKTYAPSRN